MVPRLCVCGCIVYLGVFCRPLVGGSQKCGFQKGGFGGCSLDPQNRNEGGKNGSTVPKNQNKGTKNRNDGTKNRNEGTFAKTILLQNRPFVSSRSYRRRTKSTRRHNTVNTLGKCRFSVCCVLRCSLLSSGYRCIVNKVSRPFPCFFLGNSHTEMVGIALQGAGCRSYAIAYRGGMDN